jgi:ATP-binding cassette, subfamily A (ABC1), member 3
MDVAYFEYERQGLKINQTPPGYYFKWSIPASVFLGFLAFHIFAYPFIGALLERWLHGSSARNRHLRQKKEMDGNAIRLNGFSKQYNIAVKKRDRVSAVENLSLNVHAGSITVLLGSNGSGKSTTLKAIAGLESVSGGSIEVDGTGGVGVCPQQNVMFAEMTVKEHVWLFQRLKNPAMSRQESREEVDRLISGCDLDLKVNARAKTLSGGQKRKLQLAMMLAGGSQVCCIDEASSGIDPLARRKVWDILLQERGRRTMLLTTHFLDESEVLSDHVAILSKGTLRAEGSVAYLKTSLGGGYRIVLQGAEAGLRDRDVPTSVVRRQDYNDIVYEVPDTATLTHFVAVLERNGIFQYNVHGPTIEDVFLRLADEMRGNGNGQPTSKSVEEVDDIHNAIPTAMQLHKGKGCGPLRQTGVMFMKRMTVLKHNFMPYIAALFVPLVLAGSKWIKRLSYPLERLKLMDQNSGHSLPTPS